jgi:isopentenyl diphosphate isomerase/L-lactate dehydrogenase-like FMN-dependent dehydrogenase
VLRDMSTLDLSTELFGEKLAMPVALAPVGLTGMYARRGEVQAAKAAANKGIPFTLSTVSVCPIEEVAPAISAAADVVPAVRAEGPRLHAQRAGARRRPAAPRWCSPWTCRCRARATATRIRA